jgi:hypothetical protein
VLYCDQQVINIVSGDFYVGSANNIMV